MNIISPSCCLIFCSIIPHEVVAKAVQVVLPLVLIYKRLFCVPSDLKYRLPCAADKVGVPDPKKIPNLSVLENLIPLSATPPAGIVNPVWQSTEPPKLPKPPVVVRLPLVSTIKA